ncbi:hypothetical protein [Accumulibacter sp.]|uniref:hypothetical protein n=1 Tax=Accumulibacter sp. TaxID=2053492 RepID=UPI0025F75220|nr:hypothetical protein [Accumulibacter sp.]MCM8594190.1 hypothetical protein [Accumulibacter sp.]MCM8625752.1 hypothetical protein [Accumulibacter sp.]MDS4048333.1 hypothetical protein [Accumulibacter sp.]
MVAIVDKRFADWRQAITGNVMEHLAWMSRGNVRRFFRLVRAVARKAALSQVGLPVSDTGSPPVRLALGEAAQPLQWPTASDRTWLRRFMDDSPGPAQHIEDLSRDLPTIIRLFDHSLGLDYQNGEVWYQVPEIVRAHV